MTVAELYSAFTTDPAGGSHAWIVRDAADLSTTEMQTIACDLGAPATGFVIDIEGHTVSTRFFSTTTEYGMCGHGTVGLFTCLADSGELGGDDGEDFSLTTPVATSAVRLEFADDRLKVMLSLELDDIERTDLTSADLAPLLGLSMAGIANELPIALSRSDFTHLIIPIADLDGMAEMRPDFDGLAALRHSHGIETVAAVCPTPGRSAADARVRDFCPAVGTDEAAATGTTNRVVSLYLLENGLVDATSGVVTIRAEQGVEMGRRSLIESRLRLDGGEAVEIWVGGTAAALEVRELSR